MEAIRQYILSVICVVVLCGMIQMLLAGITGSAVKLIAGLIVTIVAIQPILQGDLQLDMKWQDISENSQWAVRAGEEAAFDMISERIKNETETYILGKAEEMDADIEVDVELDDAMPPVPVEVTLRGTVAPYAKKQIIELLQQDMGISEDQQRWIS